MTTSAASAMAKGAFTPENVAAAARSLREAMGGVSRLAFAFVSSDYLADLGEFTEILRVDGHIVDVVGCVADGLIEGGHEDEGAKGFSVLSVAVPGVGSHIVSFRDGQWPSSPGEGSGDWLALAGPASIDAEAWLRDWFPRRACVVGGLASGSTAGEGRCVFHNGELVDALAIEVGTPARLVPVVAQGCRPIGEPLTVTRAENNIIYAMGSRPAYEALETAFETLSDREKSTARGNLFAGLAGTEYVEDFQARDFLVRNILGADPSSGAVAIGGIPRIGQTVQYQLRDAKAAVADLRSALRVAATGAGQPAASLVFSCTGRGRAFFGVDGQDPSAVQEAFGAHPSVGFTCAGEIGPVAGASCVHSYSLCCAAIYVKGEVA